MVCTGYVDEDTLACLYSGAAALVYPSWYEGFGLPVLEAMACGCPVICSNTSSLPEVAGDAALFFDPFREDQMAGAIERIMDDAPLRKTLACAGPKQAQPFTWDRSAQQTLELLRAR